MMTGTPIVSGPTRLLISGDIHGNMQWWRHVIKLARRHGCDGIVQVGDLGFWEHTLGGVKYLDSVERQLVAGALWCTWVDGNHENHARLRTYPVRSDGLVAVRAHLLYARRGHHWMWRGVRFLALGGAPSIDRDLRIEGESWWPEEEISEEDVQACIAAGLVDVLVCHDAPQGVPIPCDTAPYPPSQRSRALVQAVADAASPRVIFHGHWHYFHDTVLTLSSGQTRRVVGLACDQMSGSCVVLDLTTFGDDPIIKRVD